MNDERLLQMMEQYAATRDTALRDQLVEGYLPLARAVARKFAGRGAEVEDLEQVAAIALMKAIERFEPDRGFRFVTYAVPTITGEVRNHLRDRSAMVRMLRMVSTSSGLMPMRWASSAAVGARRCSCSKASCT